MVPLTLQTLPGFGSVLIKPAYALTLKSISTNIRQSVHEDVHPAAVWCTYLQQHRAHGSWVI